MTDGKQLEQDVVLQGVAQMMHIVATPFCARNMANSPSRVSSGVPGQIWTTVQKAASGYL